MAGWKQYGSYSYNWKNWTLAPNGTRVTERVWSIDVPYENINSNLRPRTIPLRLDSVSKIIGVICKGLKITKLAYDGWGEWNNPDPGETEMMMAFVEIFLVLLRQR